MVRVLFREDVGDDLRGESMKGGERASMAFFAGIWFIEVDLSVLDCFFTSDPALTVGESPNSTASGRNTLNFFLVGGGDTDGLDWRSIRLSLRFPLYVMRSRDLEDTDGEDMKDQ